MHSLFYCSVATREIFDQDILDILKVSRKNNMERDITGILVYQKKTREFLQILEGEEETIFNALGIIEDDPRHTSVDLVLEQKINERAFKNWSMAFSDLESLDKSRLEGVSEYLEKGFTSELLKNNPESFSRLVKTFRTFIEL